MSFLNRFASSIYGVLSGFDRIRFRGTQRLLASVRGLSAFLAFRGVLLKDFKTYVTGVTDRIREEVETGAQRAGVAIEYVNGSSISKEEFAAELAKSAGRTTGLRAILSAVETCRTFFVRKNAQTGMLELQNRPGKCLHYYHYWLDEKLTVQIAKLDEKFTTQLTTLTEHMNTIARLILKHEQRIEDLEHEKR